MASQTPLPPGCSPPIGYASGSAAQAGRIVFIADLLDHPAVIELEATAVNPSAA